MMAKCPQCGKECKEGAKFCGGCGCKLFGFPAVKKCPQCGKECKENAKFCGGCGYSFGTPAPAGNSVPGKDFTLVGAFIHWNILPGQLAVKIDENDIAAYGKVVKGVNIQEGVKALFFVRGQFVAELNPGSYPFKDLGGDDFRSETAKAPEHKAKPEQKGSAGGFLNAISGFFTGSSRRRAESAGLTSRIPGSIPPVSIVLVRATEFPLIFNFKEIHTANLRCEAGLHLLCRITNINAFYAGLLLDCKFISFEQLAKQLSPQIQVQLDSVLRALPPEKVDLDSCGKQLLERIQSTLAGVYPYLNAEKILQLTTVQTDLDNLRRMEEELYVSEQELAELSKRNDFLNRLQSVKNQQELAELRQKNGQEISIANLNAGFAADKEKIYEAMELTRDEQAKFDLMLAAQKQLREARTQDDLENAMQNFRKSGMFRKQELDNIEHRIQHESALRDLNDVQALAVLAMQNQQTLDQQKLEWEISIGNKRLENQFTRQRMEDRYKDERQQHEDDYEFSQRSRNAEFDDDRRRSTIALDREEQQTQLDLLRQAQALRMEREETEHRFQLESDKLKLDAANEEKRIYSAMSAEQIMAVNPDISPDAAQALAKKFEAEAAASQNDKTAQMAVDQRDQMMTFMQQQMAVLKEMAVEGIRSGASGKAELLAEKQAELERARTDVSANNQAVLHGVESTVNAVSRMRIDAVAAQTVPKTSAGKVCRKCGTVLEKNAIFCENCGESLQ